MDEGERITVPADYLLLLGLDQGAEVEVGALGKIILPPGTCVYSGSAKGGLWGRVKRHLGRPERKRWHIDHLTSLTDEKQILWRPHRDGGECESAKLLSMEYTPIANFGCSDCRCGSHLFHIGKVKPDQITRSKSE